ncbi:hypothetical protein AMS68_002520 [Peltaster fructicola]|uniref:Actin-crosslinking protein n=1 Tax=Peltaster fructicola TaxID=286661 RepID=A0A6H0XQM0_9PEZI|nr:hypothetical protein AMS68_002520 [Peltaster fructicola]
MVKALSFKGDKEPHKKRKRAAQDDDDSAKQIVPTNPADEEDQEDAWVSADNVSDISGPVFLVLSSEPVSALACDQLGKVFVSKVENMVEGLPESAEPHDVRQVFIATRVTGSEQEFSFKGHQGRYLGCDIKGTLSATREAISPEETFVCTAVEGLPGQFDLHTKRATYVTVDSDKTPPEARGDADMANETTHIRVRMQARFKPRLKTEKAEKVRAKISRKELEDEVGRRLDDDEVKILKRARREGNYHETMLDVKVKGKHDKFA